MKRFAFFLIFTGWLVLLQAFFSANILQGWRRYSLRTKASGSGKCRQSEALFLLREFLPYSFTLNSLTL